jgi:hypothetical protein
MSSEKPKPGGLASNLPPPPAPPPPVTASPAPSEGVKTVMLENQAPVVPTVMRQRPEKLPPMRRARGGSTWARWVGGPIVAAIVAGGTYALAGVVWPLHPPAPPQKPQGRLRLNSEPVGASILLDGKLFAHFTPTTVEGDIGSTMHVTFKLDGYAPKEADVYIAEGEHPFAAKLDKLATPPPPAPEPPPRPHEKPHTPPPAAGKVVMSPISVFVHPWAIVYVDGTRIHQTPLNSYNLSVGKHVIELVNESKNRREKIPIVVKPNDPQEIRREWDK